MHVACAVSLTVFMMQSVPRAGVGGSRSRSRSAAPVPMRGRELYRRRLRLRAYRSVHAYSSPAFFVFFVGAIFGMRLSVEGNWPAGAAPDGPVGPYPGPRTREACTRRARIADSQHTRTNRHATRLDRLTGWMSGKVGNQHPAGARSVACDSRATSPVAGELGEAPRARRQPQRDRL